VGVVAAETPHSVTIKSVELERLIFFSDAVFAIAITILVLELRPPERVGPDAARALAGGMVRMIPKFVSYIISFWLIGIYWFVHHRMFRHIRRWDDGLIWLNFLFLFWIAFLPFPVALMGSFGDQRLAVVFYAATLGMTGLSQILLWRHASRDGRLLDPGFDPALARYIGLRSMVPPLAALLVVILAFLIPPSLATLGFPLIFLFQGWLRRRYDPAARKALTPVRARAAGSKKPEE
jgi:uncharacterized membrane protein